MCENMEIHRNDLQCTFLLEIEKKIKNLLFCTKGSSGKLIREQIFEIVQPVEEKGGMILLMQQFTYGIQERNVFFFHT